MLNNKEITLLSHVRDVVYHARCIARTAVQVAENDEASDELRAWTRENMLLSARQLDAVCDTLDALFWSAAVCSPEMEEKCHADAMEAAAKLKEVAPKLFCFPHALKQEAAND